MTKYNLILIFLFFGLSAYGQQAKMENNHLKRYSPKFLLDVTAGANIDLISTGSVPESKLFDSKPKVVPMTGLRFTYLFSERIGGYASFQVNLYKTKKSEYYPSSCIEDIFQMIYDELYSIMTKVHPALNVGIIYRFEQNKWSIHPAVGLGYMTYLPNKESSRSFEKDGIQYNLSYTQRASSIFLNFGLSTRYLLFDNGALILDVNFQQPLQKSFAELVVTTESVCESEFYKTSTVGRNLNISIGYGFSF
jgi:hypothetical protein